MNLAKYKVTAKGVDNKIIVNEVFNNPNNANIFIKTTGNKINIKGKEKKIVNWFINGRIVRRK